MTNEHFIISHCQPVQYNCQHCSCKCIILAKTPRFVAWRRTLYPKEVREALRRMFSDGQKECLSRALLKEWSHLLKTSDDVDYADWLYDTKESKDVWCVIVDMMMCLYDNQNCDNLMNVFIVPLAEVKGILVTEEDNKSREEMKGQQLDLGDIAYCKLSAEQIDLGLVRRKKLISVEDNVFSSVKTNYLYSVTDLESFKRFLLIVNLASQLNINDICDKITVNNLYKSKDECLDKHCHVARPLDSPAASPTGVSGIQRRILKIKALNGSQGNQKAIKQNGSPAIVNQERFTFIRGYKSSADLEAAETKSHSLSFSQKNEIQRSSSCRHVNRLIEKFNDETGSLHRTSSTESVKKPFSIRRMEELALSYKQQRDGDGDVQGAHAPLIKNRHTSNEYGRVLKIQPTAGKPGNIIVIEKDAALKSFSDIGLNSIKSTSMPLIGSLDSSNEITLNNTKVNTYDDVMVTTATICDRPAETKVHLSNVGDYKPATFSAGLNFNFCADSQLHNDLSSSGQSLDDISSLSQSHHDMSSLNQLRSDISSISQSYYDISSSDQYQTLISKDEKQTLSPSCEKLNAKNYGTVEFKGAVLLQEYLYHKESLGWIKLWCVLSEDELAVYRDVSCTDIVFTLSLSDCSCTTHDSKALNSFVIQSDKETHTFSCPNAASRKTWADALAHTTNIMTTFKGNTLSKQHCTSIMTNMMSMASDDKLNVVNNDFKIIKKLDALNTSNSSLSEVNFITHTSSSDSEDVSLMSSSYDANKHPLSLLAIDDNVTSSPQVSPILKPKKNNDNHSLNNREAVTNHVDSSATALSAVKRNTRKSSLDKLKSKVSMLPDKPAILADVRIKSESTTSIKSDCTEDDLSTNEDSITDDSDRENKSYTSSDVRTISRATSYSAGICFTKISRVIQYWVCLKRM